MKPRSEGKRSKPGRFRLVQRIGSRRKVSSEADRQRSDDLPKGGHVLRETPSIDETETASIDVLGRESIISSDSETEGSCEDIIEEQEERDFVVGSQEADISVSIHTWLQDVDALVHSDEMSSFLGSSVAITTIAVKTAVHVALLPMTVPLHLASSTTGILIGTCTHVISSVCSVADRALHPTVGETTSSENPIEGLIRNVTSIIPFVFHAVHRIKDDIGSTILGVVSPVLTGDSQQKADTRNHRSEALASESSADQDESFLERLRLDYPPSPSKSIKEFCASGEELQESPRSPDVSKFLLRVCDLGISLRSEADQHEKVFHIDLSKEFFQRELTMQALDALVEKGLALLSSCPEAELPNKGCQDLVDWKPEAATAKLLRKKSKLTPDNWTALMTKEVLVWSGKIRDKDVHKADIPVFLSRGIVPVSPRGMLNLFWDDSRTRSYNKFSLGRRTSMEIEEGLDPSSTSVRATKVVQSETQVPFTGFSVVMSTLMHARQIDEPEVCYVIVSRSLSPGRAGPHVGSRSSSIEAGKNELLWGVNILRRVPDNPNLTDLTSVSQVSSAMVVQFLTHRVGIMAVESCYNAMRGV